jgi:cell shape-determining protein MreC
MYKIYLFIALISVLFGSLELTSKNLSVVPNTVSSNHSFNENEFNNFKKENDEIETRYISYSQSQRSYARSSNH